MHALPRRCLTGSPGHRGSRALPALLCLGIVLLAHAMLWRALSAPPESPVGVRAAAVQVRQVHVPPAVVVTAAATPTPMAPGATRAVTVRPPSRASRQPPVDKVQVDDAPPRVASRADTAEPPISAEPPASAAPAAATALPTYPTRIPPSASMTYAMQRGNVTGEVILHWHVAGDRYRLQLRATMSQGRPIDRQSLGGFDDAGLAPLRLTDRRNGRDVQAANFQRERGLITFSGPRWEWPLPAGAQDRLSWLVQLVAIASATPDALRDGAKLSMWVVGTRGALSAWHFEVRGRQPDGAASAWWLVREPEHPYDLRVEVWLDPARGHWPLRLRQTQVPGGEPLEWLLREEPQPVREPDGARPT